MSISIHAPRMGSDLSGAKYVDTISAFQSTLPVWGATSTTLTTPSEAYNFNPRSPYGERRVSNPAAARLKKTISIHAPRMGSDH